MSFHLTTGLVDDDIAPSEALDVRLWKAYAFRPLLVVDLSPTTLERRGPFPITTAAVNPVQPIDCDDIWNTRPLYHVGSALINDRPTEASVAQH